MFRRKPPPPPPAAPPPPTRTVYESVVRDLGRDPLADPDPEPVIHCGRCGQQLDAEGRSVDDPERETADLCLLNELPLGEYGPHVPLREQAERGRR